jgi:hypothetical protein
MFFDNNTSQRPRGFKVKNVWLNDYNYDGSRAFARANIEVGPFALQVTVNQQGYVLLPQTLRDTELRYEITTEVRRRLWWEFTEHLKRKVARDKAQLPRLKEMHERAMAEDVLS